METMATQLAGIQDMASQFAGFQKMMTTTLDKLNDLEAWKTVAETSMGAMMQKSTEATARLQQLETRPPPPPPPPPPPSVFPPPPLYLPHRQEALLHQPHAGDPHHAGASIHLGVSAQPGVVVQTSAPHPHERAQAAFDLNALPALSASSAQSPHGHGAHGEGIPGLPSSYIHQGMVPPRTTLQLQPPDSDFANLPHSSHGPKMEFPKFDGTNPRLWRDQCVLFFEVYGTPHAMKTRFAILNFKGAAASWLQMVERRGRITDWAKL
jgi:hypothetical protein